VPSAAYSTSNGPVPGRVGDQPLTGAKRRPGTATQERSIHTAQELHWTDMRALRRPQTAHNEVGATSAVPPDEWIYADLAKGDVLAARVKGVAPRGSFKAKNQACLTFHGLHSIRHTDLGPDPKDVGPGWDCSPAHSDLSRAHGVTRINYARADGNTGSLLGTRAITGAVSGAYVSEETSKDGVSSWTSSLRSTSLGMENASGALVTQRGPLPAYPGDAGAGLLSDYDTVRSVVSEVQGDVHVLPFGPMGESFDAAVDDPLLNESAAEGLMQGGSGIPDVSVWMENVVDELNLD